MKKGLAKRPFLHWPNGRSESAAKALQAGILEVRRCLLRLAAEIPVLLTLSFAFAVLVLQNW